MLGYFESDEYDFSFRYFLLSNLVDVPATVGPVASYQDLKYFANKGYHEEKLDILDVFNNMDSLFYSFFLLGYYLLGSVLLISLLGSNRWRDVLARTLW